MPVEIIGEFGTPGAQSEWIEAQGKLALKHLRKTCGEPPPEMELEMSGKSTSSATTRWPRLGGPIPGDPMELHRTLRCSTYSIREWRGASVWLDHATSQI